VAKGATADSRPHSLFWSFTSSAMKKAVLMDERRSVILVGGPDAGKTNFLCRLWLAIHDDKGLLQFDGLPNELEYLEEGSRQLLGGQFAPHTPMDVHQKNVIPVKYASGQGFRGNLLVPDWSGERWKEIYTKREWPGEWQPWVSDMRGCLVFVRIDSDQLVTPLDWISCNTLLGTPVEATGGGAKDEVPTQVMLTDWVQCLQQMFAGTAPGVLRPRIGVVVAAWDLVPTDQVALGPERYLKDNFPMFGQFLASNADLFESAVFGASIAGGDLERDPAFRDNYLESPHDSGFVYHTLCGALERSVDMTLPVAWAMGLYPAADSVDK